MQRDNAAEPEGAPRGSWPGRPRGRRSSPPGRGPRGSSGRRSTGLRIIFLCGESRMKYTERHLNGSTAHGYAHQVQALPLHCRRRTVSVPTRTSHGGAQWEVRVGRLVAPPAGPPRASRPEACVGALPRRRRRLAAGRVRRYALVLICTRPIAAVTVCISEHVRWRWAANGRLAPGLVAPSLSTTDRPGRSVPDPPDWYFCAAVACLLCRARSAMI